MSQTKLLVCIYLLRCWRPRPFHPSLAVAPFASWTETPAAAGDAGQTPPRWRSRAATAAAPSAGSSDCTEGKKKQHTSLKFCIFFHQQRKSLSDKEGERGMAAKTVCSYIMRWDGLHQQSFQFLLRQPPAGAQRADGDRHIFPRVQIYESKDRTCCYHSLKSKADSKPFNNYLICSWNQASTQCDNDL